MNCNLMIKVAQPTDKAGDTGKAASTAAAAKPAHGKSAFHKQLQKVQPKQENEGQEQKNQTRAADDTTVESDNTAATQEETGTVCAAMLQGMENLCQALLAAVEDDQTTAAEGADQNPSPQVESCKSVVVVSEEATDAVAQALATLVQTLTQTDPEADAAVNQNQPTAADAAPTTAVDAVTVAETAADTDTEQELPGKIMLMLHQNKNHLIAKLKIQNSNGNSQTVDEGPQQNAPGQVKKLLDFESQRLSAAKLSTDTDSSQTTTETGDQTSSQTDEDNSASTQTFTVVSRETPGVTKLTVRESNVQPQLPKTEEVFEQIVDQAKVMVKANSSEMQIDLKPEFLGKMTIKIMVEDGLVTAKFVTDNHQVKQMLESNLANLRQTLENNGLKVDKTEVNVQVGNNWLDGSSTGQQQSWESSQGFQSSGYAQSLVDAVSDADILEEVAASAASAYNPSDEGQMSILI